MVLSKIVYKGTPIVMGTVMPGFFKILSSHCKNYFWASRNTYCSYFLLPYVHQSCIFHNMQLNMQTTFSKLKMTCTLCIHFLHHISTLNLLKTHFEMIKVKFVLIPYYQYRIISSLVQWYPRSNSQELVWIARYHQPCKHSPLFQENTFLVI